MAQSQSVNIDTYLALLDKAKNEMFPTADQSTSMETDDQTPDATADGTASGTAAGVANGMEVDPSKDKRPRPTTSDDEAPDNKSVRTEHGQFPPADGDA